MTEDDNLPVCVDQTSVSKWDKIEIPDDPRACWPYRGSITSTGYALVGLDDTTDTHNSTLHRVLFAAFHDMHIDDLPSEHVHHKCGVTYCMNPLHLEGVTKSEHGERHSSKHLTAVELAGVRALRERGEPLDVIAEKLGMSVKELIDELKDE